MSTPTTLSTRLPMLAAMAGFLVMAIATPDAFESAAWAFALAYTVVVVIHGVQFARSSLGGSAEAIWEVMWLNLGVAGGLLLAAVLEPHGAAWVGWGFSFAVIVFLVARGSAEGFTLRADHFAERHQLLIIIALGETVVATGAGAQGRLDEFAVLLAVLLSLTLLAGLWWVYFGGDDSRGAERLASEEESRMASDALWSYGMVHFLHIIGLILVAAGLHYVVAAPTEQLSVQAAVDLGVGTAVFVLAQLEFRRRMLIGRLGVLGGAAVLCGVAVLLGRAADGLVELTALAVVVVGALVIDGSTPTVE